MYHAITNRQSYRHADARRHQQHTAVAAAVTSNRANGDLELWPFDHWVTACRATAIEYTCTKFGVDSSHRFPFRTWTNRCNWILLSRRPFQKEWWVTSLFGSVFSLSPKFGLRPKLIQKVKSFFSGLASVQSFGLNNLLSDSLRPKFGRSESLIPELWIETKVNPNFLVSVLLRLHGRDRLITIRINFPERKTTSVFLAERSKHKQTWRWLRPPE